MSLPHDPSDHPTSGDPSPDPSLPEPLLPEPSSPELCASCGRTAEAGERWQWTNQTDRAGRPQIVCPACAREHARNFEAGLEDV